MPVDPEGLRLTAREAYRRGDFHRAREALVTLINSHRSGNVLTAGDLSFLSLSLYSCGDLAQAYVAMGEAASREPANVEYRMNLAFMARKTGRLAEALALAENLARERPDDANLFSLLAPLYHELGRDENARTAGRRSLELKDRSAAASPAPSTPVPPFNGREPRRNVISFSLWGNREGYIAGAIRNAEIAPVIYEGWSCRFYVDASVPPPVRERLKQCGADLILMQPAKRAFAGLFWRFLVADDPGVDRYLVRDADSVVNVRERVAVDEWITSHRHFHVMRDYWTHTELILAGLWGGVGGALPSMADAVAAFLASYDARRLHLERTIDQRFLREAIWPVVRHSLLAHDSAYRFGGAMDFPAVGARASGFHVGQNDSAFRDWRAELIPGRELTPPAADL